MTTSPSRSLRLATSVAAIALLVTLAASCGDDGGGGASPSTTDAPAGDDGTIVVELAGGEVVGGVQRFPVDSGATVRIEVTADVADEVHLHGYDLMVDVAPGEPAVLEFDADIPGVFEAELEDAHLPLFELEIS